MRLARGLRRPSDVKTILFTVLLAGATAACTRETSQPAPGTTTATQPSSPSASPAPTTMTSSLPAGLTRVADASQVCMVNNQYMGKPQIPVEVEGRTYFGCCAMCKDRLNNDPSSRTAQDPVTGESVDKAKAVIVQDAGGKVMYFASEDTLSRYRG